jgi:hypothetical protein
MDLTIEAVDAAGRTGRVALSAYGPVRRPLESYVYRRAGRDAQRFGAVYELVLQTYTIPLSDFAASGGFDPATVKSIRWVFDRSIAGTVWLDNVGFSRMRPEFMAARALNGGRAGAGAAR